jgi:hypothetical protein
MKQQTALEFYRHNLMELVSLKESKFKTENEIYEITKAMEKEQAQQYAEFAIECDRRGLPILEFDGWIDINTYEGNK